MIATAIMLPILTVIADFVGMLGGFLIAYFTLGLSSTQYWKNGYEALEYNDIVQGLLKPFIFGFIISLVGCFYGLRTTGGTQGVGRATTEAVVVASVWVFLVTSLITRIFVNLH
jgi:phospholipid/cholesterol/gamma-HCH transport system permease protein